MSKKRWTLPLIILIGIGLISWYIYDKNNVNASEQVIKKAEKSEKKFEKTVDEQIKQQHFQGTVLLAEKGHPIYQKAYGYANQKQKVPNTIGTLYPIASLQKMMTGILIAQLIQENKLELSTTIQTFYPTLPDADKITIQELLNHCSGIEMPEVEPSEVLTTEAQQIDFALQTLTVSADKEFSYTNANYTLLAGIVAQIDKKTYEQVVEDKIVKPLKLTNTFFWDTLPKGQVIPEAYLYDDGKDYQADPFPSTTKLFSSLLGAGNIYMTAENMLVVQNALTDGQLFEDKNYFHLLAVTPDSYSAGLLYSDGLKYSEGQLGGYETMIYGDQDNQRLVILFANQAPDNIQELSESLYDTIKTQEGQ